MGKAMTGKMTTTCLLAVLLAGLATESMADPRCDRGRYWDDRRAHWTIGYPRLRGPHPGRYWHYGKRHRYRPWVPYGRPWRHRGFRRDLGGCYRIERLPNGRERRIELPPSACR